MYLNALHTLSIVYNDIRFEIIVYITNICQNIVCDVVKRIKNIILQLLSVRTCKILKKREERNKQIYGRNRYSLFVPSIKNVHDCE